MSKFLDAKIRFDQEHQNKDYLSNSPIPVNGKMLQNIKVKNEKHERIEEYYKWQFISSIINSGLYPKDYIGAEIHFPKGNKASTPLKIDACIFNDKDWLVHYHKWIDTKDDDAVEWLRKILFVPLNLKKN